MRIRRTVEFGVLTVCAVALAVAVGVPNAAARGSGSVGDTTVAATPPMGWNSWNYYGTDISESDIKAAARALVSSGMAAAGYKYVVIDDGWSGKRDKDGRLEPNSNFGNMKELAAYVHSLGLRLGIYSSPGPTVCAGNLGYGTLGSYGHVAQDAKTFASWGVDYLKYDLCSYRRIMLNDAPGDRARQLEMMKVAYKQMGDALHATGRPIVFSLCQYGLDAVWSWGTAVGGNLWRTTYDINPTWDRIRAIVSAQVGLAKYAGPGHWNDPDMLEVGNGKLTLAEDRSHFTWWAMLAAPLMAGNDIAAMTPAVASILTNRAVIAIDQDALGEEGAPVYQADKVAVWERHLVGGAIAVAIFNLGGSTEAVPFHLDLAKLGLRGSQSGVDLWSGKDVVLRPGEPISLGRHDVLLVRISKPTYRR